LNSNTNQACIHCFVLPVLRNSLLAYYSHKFCFFCKVDRCTGVDEEWSEALPCTQEWDLERHHQTIFSTLQWQMAEECGTNVSKHSQQQQAAVFSFQFHRQVLLPRKGRCSPVPNLLPWCPCAHPTDSDIFPWSHQSTLLSCRSICVGHGSHSEDPSRPLCGCCCRDDSRWDP
jgi:hypothetical protein